MKNYPSYEVFSTKEKKSVKLTLFENDFKCFDILGNAPIHESYSSIDRVDHNKATLKCIMRDSRVLDFRREKSKFTNDDWDSLLHQFKSKVQMSVKKSPFTRGSSVRDLDQLAPVPFSLNSDSKRIALPSPIAGRGLDFFDEKPKKTIAYSSYVPVKGYTYSRLPKPISSNKLASQGFESIEKFNFDFSSSPDPGRGIKNTGNSCYFNAILQALTGLPTFVYDLKDKRVKDANLEKESFYQTLVQIINQSSEKNQTPIDPLKAQNAVSKRYKQFANKRQQDAHELLGTFLAILELELAPFLKKKKESIRSLGTLVTQLPIAERPGLFCPTKRNFSFVIKRYFICNGCKDQKEVVEIFRDLSVEIFDYEDIEQWNKSLLSKEVKEWMTTISNPLTVHDMLRFYFLPESIERTCKCGCSDTIIKKRIASLPRIFIFHIKRFIHHGSEGMHKIVSKVNISNEIHFDSSMLLPNTGPIEFDLSKLPKNSVQEKQLNHMDSEDDDLVNENALNEEKMDVQSSGGPNLKRTFEDICSNITEGYAKAKNYDAKTESSETSSEDHSDFISDDSCLNTMQDEIEDLGFLMNANGNTVDNINQGKFLNTSTNAKYRLKCIVHHLGARVTSGHYTAEIYDNWKKQWYLYNDSRVTKSTPELNKSSTAYILFYVNDACSSKDGK